MANTVTVTIFKDLHDGYVVVTWQGMHYRCSVRDLTWVGGNTYEVDVDNLKVYSGH